MSEETLWDKFKKNGTVGKIEGIDSVKPWDIINPKIEKASKDDSENRYSLCLQCPELLKLTKQCKKCGCFMEIKTKLKAATCPIGKW